MAQGEGGRMQMRRPEELWRLRASQAVSSSFHLPFQRSLDNSVLLFTQEENVQSINYGFLIQWFFGLFSQTELGAHTAGNFSDYGDFVAREIILTGWCYLPVRLRFPEISKRLMFVAEATLYGWMKNVSLTRTKERGGIYTKRRCRYVSIKENHDRESHRDRTRRARRPA